MRDEYNILIDDLPATVCISGRSFPIQTDFRTGILFELSISDKEMSKNELLQNTLELYFGDHIPDDLDGTISAILWFYRCGYKPPDKRRRRNENANEEPQEVQHKVEARIFDYEEDAALIYAAFWSQYGIDLQSVDYMHWWAFSALFHGLHDEKICEIMKYRAVDLSEIKDKEMRKYYAELKGKYALQDGRSVEEKVSIAGNAFAGGFM